MVIKVLYSVFLGALVVLFVGWTMAALLPAPTWDTEYGGEPQWESMPQQPSEAELQGLPLAERQARFAQYKQEEAAYEARGEERDEMRKALLGKTEKRSRNVSLISLVIAVVVVSNRRSASALPTVGATRQAPSGAFA